MSSPYGTGAYVHIPFCERRCDYCDFATWTDRSHLMAAYVDACVSHAQALRGEHPGAIDHVFFGGGTPSLLPPDDLGRIVDALQPTPDAEITVEVNPDSFSDRHARVYAASGVNRISMGVQSMDDEVLVALGRTHNRDNVAQAVRAARGAGIEHVNVDLIYGSPVESFRSWIASVSAALSDDIDHLSCYALTVEPGTPLGASVAAGTARAPDDDDQAAKYEAIDELCESAGLSWYEISNWARPGGECRHNQNTWAGGNYLAVGAAAHGFMDGARFWNVRTPERYIEAVSTTGDPVAVRVPQSLQDRYVETLMLGLRTRTGVDLAGWPDAVIQTAADLVDIGLLVAGGRSAPPNFDQSGRPSQTRDADSCHGADGQRFSLTRRGRLLASHVMSELASHLPDGR